MFYLYTEVLGCFLNNSILERNEVTNRIQDC